jgi:hypothetical protein
VIVNADGGQEWRHRDAMHKYAKGLDPSNNPAAYAHFLANTLHVAEGTRIGDLNPGQFTLLMQAIKKQEGTVSGAVVHMSAADIAMLGRPQR